MTRQMEADELRPMTIEHYVLVLWMLRRCFPEAYSPGEITPAMKTHFKAMRLEDGRLGRQVSIRTLRGKLNTIYNQRLVGACRLLTVNPFAEDDVPKVDCPSPGCCSPKNSRSSSGRCLAGGTADVS